MTTATAPAPVQSTTQDSRSLEQQLSILNTEQQEALFAYYGEGGLAKFDSLTNTNATPSQFETALAGFINNDTDEAQKKELLSQLEGYNHTYRLKEQTFSNAEDKAKKLLEAKRNAKKDLNKSVSTFTKSLEKNLTDTNKELLQQRRIDQQNQQAWEKREKIRVRGIDAYLKGVVAAVIDDIEDEYREKAATEAERISKIANAQVKALEDKGGEPTSMEGTKLIFKNAFPKKKQVVAARAGLDNSKKNDKSSSGNSGKGFGSK